jgi:hypothetical protein
MIRRVTDSVSLLEARLGDTIRWKALDRFFQNFQQESKFYVQYSLKLSNQVLETRSALVLLQTNGFTINGTVLKVNGGKESQEQYQTHLNKITIAANQASEAFQTTVDETAKSNKIVIGVLETLSK